MKFSKFLLSAILLLFCCFPIYARTYTVATASGPVVVNRHAYGKRHARHYRHHRHYRAHGWGHGRRTYPYGYHYRYHWHR